MGACICRRMVWTVLPEFHTRGLILYMLLNLQVRKRLTHSDLEALQQFDRQSLGTSTEASAVVSEFLMRVHEADATVATIACCNPPCGAVQTVAGPAFKRCSICHAAVYCCKNCQTVHWQFHKQACSPALGTCSDLSSKALHAVTVTQRLLTLHMPSIRLHHLRMQASQPDPGYVVLINALSLPSTVCIKSVAEMRALVIAMERGLGYKWTGLVDEAELEIGCVRDGTERAADEKLCAYSKELVDAERAGERVAWMPAVTMNLCVLTFLRQAVAMPPLAAEWATVCAMAPEELAAHLDRLVVESCNA